MSKDSCSGHLCGTVWLVEAHLAAHPSISQALVVGERARCWTGVQLVGSPIQMGGVSNLSSLRLGRNMGVSGVGLDPVRSKAKLS